MISLQTVSPPTLNKSRHQFTSAQSSDRQHFDETKPNTEHRTVKNRTKSRERPLCVERLYVHRVVVFTASSRTYYSEGMVGER